jgi:hypothetical protein
MFGDYKTFLVKFCDDVTTNAYTKTHYGSKMSNINASFRSFIQQVYMLHKVYFGVWKMIFNSKN